MPDAPSPLARIDAALARIEGALAARERDGAAMVRRHLALRRSMTEAVQALDAVIAKGGD